MIDDKFKSKLFSLIDSGFSTKDAASKIGMRLRSAQRFVAQRKIASESSAEDIAPTAGQSVLLDSNGNVRLRWVKQLGRQDNQKSIIEAFFADTRPVIRQSSGMAITSDDMDFYPLTDFHLGMMAWHEESGEDWDIEKAENSINYVIDNFMTPSKNGKSALLGVMGDFFHWDGLDAVTPKHKNALDADTRFPKVVRTGIRILRRAIETLKSRYDHVNVLICEGNHDLASSVWLREGLGAMYPGIVIMDSSQYQVYKFGGISIVLHHGHVKRGKKLADIISGMLSNKLKGADFIFVHNGHGHSYSISDFIFCIIEEHPTIIAHDAFAASFSSNNRRHIQRITYRDGVGEVARKTLHYCEIKDGVKNHEK